MLWNKKKDGKVEEKRNLYHASQSLKRETWLESPPPDGREMHKWKKTTKITTTQMDAVSKSEILRQADKTTIS